MLTSIISSSKPTAYQQKIKQNHQKFAEIAPQIDEKVQVDLEKYLSCGDAWVLLLNKIISLCERFHTVYVAHQWLAGYLGIHRDTVQRLVKKLVELGFIATCFRGVKKTLLYKVSPMFQDKDFRMRARYWLPALRFIPFVVISTAINGALYAVNLSLKRSGNKPDVGQVIDSYILKSNGVGGRESYGRTTITSKGAIGKKRGGNLGEPSSKEEERGIVPSRSELMKRDYVIPGIRLTVWGRIKLGAFPKEAIEYAISRIRSGSNLRDPFAYVMKLANEWCKERNISPDWKRYFEITNVLEMPAGAPNFVPERYASISSLGKTTPRPMPRLEPDETRDERDKRMAAQAEKERERRQQLRAKRDKEWQEELSKKTPQEREEHKNRVLEFAALLPPQLRDGIIRTLPQYMGEESNT